MLCFIEFLQDVAARSHSMKTDNIEERDEPWCIGRKTLHKKKSQVEFEPNIYIFELL